MKIEDGRRKALGSLILCLALLGMTLMAWQAPLLAAGPDEQAPPPASQPSSAPLTPAQLQQLEAPIALYPDSLVAQILAASEYPTQIVEADRFLQYNPTLSGEALAAQVNQEYWDPSVKALTQFPSVLADMDKNLSWTSELGDANYHQPQDVMDAIQVLRRQAQAAGNLQSTPQQNVTAQGSTVIIEPANPQVVYVPEYDPELVYGYPMALWPGFYPWWGIASPYISFGIGFNLGPFWGFGWGWPVWGCNWIHGRVFYHGGFYAFHHPAYYYRNDYFHGESRGDAPNARADRGFHGVNPRAGRSFAPHAGRTFTARAGHSFSPRGGSAFASRGGRSFTPRGGRSFTPRGGNSFNPRASHSGYWGNMGRSGISRSFTPHGGTNIGRAFHGSFPRTGGGFHGGGFHGGGFHGGHGRR